MINPNDGKNTVLKVFVSNNSWWENYYYAMLNEIKQVIKVYIVHAYMHVFPNLSYAYEKDEKITNVLLIIIIFPLSIFEFSGLHTFYHHEKKNYF